MKFERLNKQNKILIGKVIMLAYFNDCEIYFVNYQKEDREDGTPDFNNVIMSDILSVLDMEDFSLADFRNIDFQELTEYIKECSPEFDSGGCNDLVIMDKENNDYYIWYFDHRENRVYTDEINLFIKFIETSLNINKDETDYDL